VSPDFHSGSSGSGIVCATSRGWFPKQTIPFFILGGFSFKVSAFIADYQAVDRIIDHLKLVFVAEKPPPSRVIEQVALMAAEERAEYF
jgi:hypothetical protein